ncbi:MAG: PqqD family peptide modification chaperone [Armatimonadia bacterium]|nr:PqqD family peptide modification chaperone [Armatimonadia bacterium]
MKLPSAVNSVLQRVGLKKKQMPLSRDEAFEARPVRNPALKWRINDEEVVEVIVPRRKDMFGRLMGFLFFVPESRPITLDEVGTRVWNLCDGEHTVQEIVAELSEDYKLQRREVEVSLTEYLRTLGKKGMVGFLVPQEFVEDEDEGELVGLQDVGSTREDLERARQEAEEARAAEEAAEEEADGADMPAPDAAEEGTEDEADDADTDRSHDIR